MFCQFLSLSRIHHVFQQKQLFIEMINACRILILLKDMMNTDAAKEKAWHRQFIMESYLEEFMAEWEGER